MSNSDSLQDVTPWRLMLRRLCAQVLAVYGSWHLEHVQLGLSRAASEI